MPPEKCQNWNRCSKYTELTLKIDRQAEALAAKDRRIRALEEENARLKDAQCGGTPEAAASAPGDLIALDADDLTGMVINPYGNAFILDKETLKGFLDMIHSE